MADRNVKVKVEGQVLHIEVDLSVDLGPSKSGKSRLVASTGGAVEVTDGEGASVFVNLTAYRK